MSTTPPPVAANDGGSAPLTINVLANDTDIEGGLTVTSVTRGASPSASQTIEVLTAPLAIELLMEKVNESRVTRAIKRELLAVLRTALNQSKNERIRPARWRGSAGARRSAPAWRSASRPPWSRKTAPTTSGKL